MKSRERADADGNLAKLIAADIQGPNRRGNGVQRHTRELVVGEIQHGKARGPLGDVRQFLQLVVGEVELLETGQLQDAAWDGGQVVVLQIQLHNLGGAVKNSDVNQIAMVCVCVCVCALYVVYTMLKALPMLLLLLEGKLHHYNRKALQVRRDAPRLTNHLRLPSPQTRRQRTNPWLIYLLKVRSHLIGQGLEAIAGQSQPLHPVDLPQPGDVQHQ